MRPARTIEGSRGAGSELRFRGVAPLFGESVIAVSRRKRGTMTRRIGGGRFRRTDVGLAARATRYLAAAVIGAALFAPGATSQTAPRPGQRVALVTGSTSGLGRE